MCDYKIITVKSSPPYCILCYNWLQEGKKSRESLMFILVSCKGSQISCKNKKLTFCVCSKCPETQMGKLPHARFRSAVFVYHRAFTDCLFEERRSGGNLHLIQRSCAAGVWIVTEWPQDVSFTTQQHRSAPPTHSHYSALRLLRSHLDFTPAPYYCHYSLF